MKKNNDVMLELEKKRKYIPNIINSYIDLKPIKIDDSDFENQSSYLKPVDKEIPDIYKNGMFKHSHFKEFICFTNEDKSIFMTNLGSIIINPDKVDVDAEDPNYRIGVFGLKTPLDAKDNMVRDFRKIPISRISDKSNIGLVNYENNLLDTNYFTLRTVIDIGIDLYFHLGYNKKDMSIIEFFSEFIYETNVKNDSNASFKDNSPKSKGELDIIFYIDLILDRALDHIEVIKSEIPRLQLTDADYHRGVYYAILQYDRLYKGKKFSWNAALPFTVKYTYKYPSGKNKFEAIARMQNLNFFISQAIKLLVDGYLLALKNMTYDNVPIDNIYSGLEMNIKDKQFKNPNPIWVKKASSAISIAEDLKTSGLHINNLIMEYIFPLINSSDYQATLTKPQVDMLKPICNNPNKFKHILVVIYNYLLINLGRLLKYLEPEHRPKYAHEILTMPIYKQDTNVIYKTYEEYLKDWINSDLSLCQSIILIGIGNLKHKDLPYIDICGPILNIPCEFKHNSIRYQYARLGNAPYLSVSYNMLKDNISKPTKIDDEEIEYPSNIFELLVFDPLKGKGRYTKSDIKESIDELVISYNINYLNKFKLAANKYYNDPKYFLCSAYYSISHTIGDSFPLNIKTGDE